MEASVPLQTKVHALMEDKVHVLVKNKVTLLENKVHALMGDKVHAHGEERSCARGRQGSHTQVKQSSSTDPVPPSGNPRCLYCSRNHALEDCQALRWKPYPERIQFLASHMLCFGCLSSDHVLRFCPQRMTCKIAKCTRKHPSILHTNFRERPTTNVGVGTESRSNT